MTNQENKTKSPLLEVRNLQFQYHRKGTAVLQDVNMTLEAGEIGILLGPNGVGKTTLFRTILGMERLHSGEILLEGNSLAEEKTKKRAMQIAYVPQNIAFGDLTVFDTVMTGRIPFFGWREGPEDVQMVERILSEMGMEQLAQRRANRLSGGEKQKVAIARALVGNPKLIIFDEPTGNLDPANERLLIEETKKLAKERGIGILCSLHGINAALELGDRFYLMRDGSIRYSGGKEILTARTIRDVFGISVELLEWNGRTIVV